MCGCSKPLSAVLPRKVRHYAVADQPLFAAPQPVNPSFSRLAGAAAVGSKRWGSVTFAEMERLERLFRCQLEATSSSLWMMSGILAMLKRDGFNPSHPILIQHGHFLRFGFSGVSERIWRPRGRCSFALSIGSLSWRTRRSRFQICRSVRLL